MPDRRGLCAVLAFVAFAWFAAATGPWPVSGGTGASLLPLALLLPFVGAARFGSRVGRVVAGLARRVP